MALLVGHQTCDSQATGSSPGQASPCIGLGQATYTCVFLSPSSIISYGPQGSDALWLGRQMQAKSNGSLPQALWLSHMQADCQETEIISEPDNRVLYLLMPTCIYVPAASTGRFYLQLTAVWWLCITILLPQPADVHLLHDRCVLSGTGIITVAAAACHCQASRCMRCITCVTLKALLKFVVAAGVALMPVIIGVKFMYIFSIDVPPQNIYSYYTFACIMLMILMCSVSNFWEMYNMNKYSEVGRLWRKYTWILLLLSVLGCDNFHCYVIGQWCNQL